MATDSTLHPSGSPAASAERSRGMREGAPVFSLREQPEQSGLPAALSRRHLIALLLLIILSIANVSGVQFGGPATFLYWALALLTFLVPCALVTQWLARRFPGQSAPYFWAAHMLGNNWSFFSAFCTWWPGILEVIATIESGLLLVQYLAPTWLSTPLQQCLAIVLILTVTTAMTCLPLRWLKHLLLALAALYLFVFMLLGVAGGWWLFSGHPAATALNSASQWQPTSGNFALYGLIVLFFLGVDAPLFLGGELRDGKAAGLRNSRYVWWGGALSLVAYLAGTFGVLVIVPPGQAGALGANIMALQMALGPVVGKSVGLMLIVSQMLIPIVYLLVFSRLLVLVAQDRRLPASLTKVNRYGVPVRSIVVQAVIVACVTVLTFVAIPSLFGTRALSADVANEAFAVLTAGTTVVWACYFVLLFVFVLWFLLRRKEQAGVRARHRWLLLGASVLGIGASGVSIWSTVFTSAIPGLVSDKSWAVLMGGFVLSAIAVAYIGSEISLRTQLQVANKKQEELLGEVNRLYREQAQAALTDAITGLPNHRAVMSRIEEELVRCQRTQEACAIVFVDLDHFKHVNDTWGHRAGDAVLREASSRLQRNMRQGDAAGRFGGEEFVLLLPNTDLQAAKHTAERLRVALAEEPCMLEPGEDAPAGNAIAITASLGVAVFGEHGTSREALIEAADRAMYYAKRAGRNRVCLAGEETGLTSQVLAGMRQGQVTETVGVNTLAAVASVHDGQTSAHAHRMVRLAEETARRLGRSEEEIHLVRLAALFHDIGKIGIPDAILHKPGPLNEDEWTVMRRHPVLGQHILEQVGGVFELLSHIVVAHHERWDGQGYPHGLAQNAIPLGARILTVVDSYDAMTSQRPYRPPLSDEEARTELQRCAGSQYDPQVVEMFLQVLDADARTQEPALMEEFLHDAPSSPPRAARPDRETVAG
jgi:diguanylate cyclase (GGDEF)-like protein